jgi:hypothetical protein
MGSGRLKRLKKKVVDSFRVHLYRGRVRQWSNEYRSTNSHLPKETEMFQTQPTKLSPLPPTLTLPTMFAPPAILLPPLPAGAPSLAVTETDPCTSLTPEALQQVIDKLAESLAKAESDVNANGTTGTYAIAAVYNRDYLVEVQGNVLFLQSWLKNLGLDTPFVTNASAAYNIHGYVREGVYLMHHARHWATISVVYHKSSDAFDSYGLTSEALGLAEALGEQAGRCYMRSYFP